MDERIVKHFCVYSAVLVSPCYCYFISSRIPKGVFRLISLIPIFCIFTILPLYLPYPTVFITSLTPFCIAWVANFRLLLFAFGQGPLSAVQSSKSLHIFIISATLPLRTNPINDPPPSFQLNSKHKKKISVLGNLGAKIFASSVLIGLLIHYSEILVNHTLISLIGYGCLLFLLLDFVFTSSNLLVRALVRMELDPPFNKPFLSTSLQEFWGKRWNLVVSNLLRETVYKPVRAASAALFGKELAPAPAIFAAFVGSGLMHELLLYYAIRAKPSWEMTSFFILHGICVVVEIAAKKALKGRRMLPWFFSCPLTIGFVILTSFGLFFKPLITNRVDLMLIEEMGNFLEISGVEFLTNF